MSSDQWVRHHAWKFVGSVFVALAAWEAYLGAWISVLLYFLIGVLIVAWMRGWGARNNTTHREARKAFASGRAVVIYWRPGCLFCAKLRLCLGRQAKKATWINIWEDDDAAKFVRSVNNGNELVPTVLMRGEAIPNPDVGDVRAALQETSPPS